MREQATVPLVARRRVGGALPGTLRSFRRGPGSDLTGLRPYVAGDDVRRIDHRASARLSSARGSDEFVVREDLTEDRGRVVLVVDRRPAMALSPDRLPWLSKPRAIAAAGRLVLATALEHRCLVGYLDEAEALHADRSRRPDAPFWRPADGTTESYRVGEEYLRQRPFQGPDDAVARALGFLCTVERGLPAGTYVFVLSDFLVPPPAQAWSDAIARGWDLVPVVVQDPRWDASFPDVAGCPLPLADERGRARVVRLGAREVADRREAHERRLAGLLEGFSALGLDWVQLGSDDPLAVHEAFDRWALGRRLGARIAR